jgi:hemolysin
VYFGGGYATAVAEDMTLGVVKIRNPKDLKPLEINKPSYLVGQTLGHLTGIGLGGTGTAGSLLLEVVSVAGIPASGGMTLAGVSAGEVAKGYSIGVTAMSTYNLVKTGGKLLTSVAGSTPKGSDLKKDKEEEPKKEAKEPAKEAESKRPENSEKKPNNNPQNENKGNNKPNNKPPINNGEKVGGRKGSATTRAQNQEIAEYLKDKDWDITGGGNKGPEEYMPPLDTTKGKTKGSNYVDVTATKIINGEKVTIRINTVDTYKRTGGLTNREAKAAEMINIKIERLGKDPKLITIPKGQGLGNLEEELLKIEQSESIK